MDPDASETAVRIGGYDPEHYRNLAAIEDRHFWFRARNQAIGALAAQVCAGFPSGYRALEVGCGTGNVLRRLEEICHGGVVIGMDLFGQGFPFARQRAHCPLVQADAGRPPFARQFHLIGMFDVIEHVPDDVSLLSDAFGLLAPGGALLVTVPAHMSMWSYFDEASNHCRRYELEELRSRLQDAGFAVEFLSEYMCSVAPLVWLKRRMAGRNRSAVRPADIVKDELKIYPLVNAALAFLLNQEARWLSLRRRLPFGASLIAIARKPARPKP
jgi:SAM-dependent methyltransferase